MTFHEPAHVPLGTLRGVEPAYGNRFRPARDSKLSSCSGGQSHRSVLGVGCNSESCDRENAPICIHAPFFFFSVGASEEVVKSSI